jgi:hypothetical protein
MDENPMTRLWHQLVTNSLLVAHLFEFMKLIKLAIVQVVGSVEDERTFSTLFFIMSKLHNCLVGHLNIAIHMFPQYFFTKKTFPFHHAITNWNDGIEMKVGVNA